MASELTTVTMALAQMAVFRCADVSAETLDLFAKRIIADGCEPADVVKACQSFEAAPRAEGETAFPEIGRMLNTVRVFAQRRREQERSRQLPPLSNEPTYRCAQCLDDPSGWVKLACPSFTCEREKAHAPHSYVVRCPHWLKLHRDEIQEAALQALQKGLRPSSVAAALQDVDAGTYHYQHAVTAIARQRRAV